MEMQAGGTQPQAKGHLEPQALQEAGRNSPQSLRGTAALPTT